MSQLTGKVAIVTGASRGIGVWQSGGAGSGGNSACSVPRAAYKLWTAIFLPFRSH
jgi:short-subunit dehydrogenase